MQETAKAADAFEEYAIMGPSRSLRKLAERRGQKEGKSRVRLATLEEWSSAHNWQERVKAYDAEQRAIRRAQREASIDVMNEEHALLGRTQAIRAVKQIQALIEAGKFGSQAAVSLFKIATDLERIARGGVTERTEQEITGGMVAVYLPEKHSGNALQCDSGGEKGEH